MTETADALACGARRCLAAKLHAREKSKARRRRLVAALAGAPHPRTRSRLRESERSESSGARRRIDHDVQCSPRSVHRELAQVRCVLAACVAADARDLREVIVQILPEDLAAAGDATRAACAVVPGARAGVLDVLRVSDGQRFRRDHPGARVCQLATLDADVLIWGRNAAARPRGAKRCQTQQQRAARPAYPPKHRRSLARSRAPDRTKSDCVVTIAGNIQAG